MGTNGITCELVDERDLDTRYIAGRLNPEEAEGFEAHFFACERCWALVQQGVEVRSALSPDPGASHSQREASGFRRTGRGWWGLAAAAAVAAVMLGTWWTGQPSGLGPAEDVLRGGEVPFLVTSSGTDAALQATWPRLPDADLYRVRLYASDGSLVGAWEVADTAIALERESLPLPPGTAAFWQVQALDRLRNPIAGSELTRAVLPSSVP
ncbi:MAG: zf-HC2 domain-containing protein [Gemmatimonadales bacterium]